MLALLGLSWNLGSWTAAPCSRPRSPHSCARIAIPDAVLADLHSRLARSRFAAQRRTGVAGGARPWLPPRSGRLLGRPQGLAAAGRRAERPPAHGGGRRTSRRSIRETGHGRHTLRSA